MSKLSITFKLLAFIMIAFFATTLSVLFLASEQLNEIIDDSQHAVYSEKLDAILGTLDRITQRLHLTENVEAYEEDFKQSAIQNIAQVYYRTENSLDNLIIIGADGRIVMHPVLRFGDMSLAGKEYIKKVLNQKDGDFNYTREDGKAQWVIFRHFDEWDWIICYTLPLSVKYADSKQFRKSLILIMTVIAVIVLSTLTILITRFTKPIIRLTKISAEMANGNLEIPINTSSSDEVGVLSRSFVHMRDSIREKILELEQEITQRKSAQAEQARLIKIVESTSDLVATARTNLTFMFMNHSGREMVGWSEDENIDSKKISDILPDWAYLQILNTGIPEAMERGIWKGETVVIGPEGNEIPVSQVIMSHKSPHGQIEYLSMIIRDISERRFAEIALAESEEKYRSLTNNLNVGVYRNEAGFIGKFIEANPAIIDLFGYESKEEFLNTSAIDLYITSEDRNAFVRKLIRDGSVMNEELQLKRKDGTPFIASVSAVAAKSESEEVNYYDGIIEDITERKQIEEALRDSEEKYRTVLESIEDGYYEVDMNGNIVFFNDSMCEILRYPKDSFMGTNYTAFMDHKNATKIRKAFGEVKSSGIPTKALDWELIRRDGSECFVETVVSLIRDKDGKPVGFRGIARDVTERKHTEKEKKQLETKLQQVQKMEALGTLAGGIAHDFNNILMGVQGRISLMAMGTDAKHSHFEHLKGIETYIKSATNLTKQLLGFARGGKYEIKPTNLNKLIVQENQLFGRTRKEILIKEKLEQDLWAVEIDRAQIQQVLLNIYVNAWQAMPGGGNLYIQTDNVTVTDDSRRLYQVDPGRYVKISITDNGTGMDEETRKKIFDPFFTTKEIGRGTGLGLASAYGIIKNHRGFINVYSAKGEGTTFNIYLPACEKEAEDEIKVDGELIRGSGNILLVDDEDIIIEVGSMIIESIGYKVMTAQNGKEAVNIYKNNQDRIDLVVLDMIMPDMSGRETYNSLKNVNPEVKVLLSSGYSIEGQASEILECGCNGFIQKPFNLTEVSKKISEILEMDH